MIAQVNQRFENAVEGDKVWSCLLGGGVIWRIADGKFPLEVNFPSAAGIPFTFTLCGRARTGDVYCELYHSEKEFIEERVQIHNYKPGKHMIASHTKTEKIEGLKESVKNLQAGLDYERSEVASLRKVIAEMAKSIYEG